jgi:DNA repair exonuclease SbcCD ATPase subunit
MVDGSSELDAARKLVNLWQAQWRDALDERDALQAREGEANSLLENLYDACREIWGDENVDMPFADLDAVKHWLETTDTRDELKAERDQLQARVEVAEALAKEMVAAYESCDQECSELQARVSASPCLGIEIEPGVYSGCDQSGGDCPICGK